MRGGALSRKRAGTTSPACTAGATARARGAQRGNDRLGGGGVGEERRVKNGPLSGRSWTCRQQAGLGGRDTCVHFQGRLRNVLSGCSPPSTARGSLEL